MKPYINVYPRIPTMEYNLDGITFKTCEDHNGRVTAYGYTYGFSNGEASIDIDPHYHLYHHLYHDRIICTIDVDASIKRNPKSSRFLGSQSVVLMTTRNTSTLYAEILSGRFVSYLRRRLQPLILTSVPKGYDWMQSVSFEPLVDHLMTFYTVAPDILQDVVE